MGLTFYFLSPKHKYTKKHKFIYLISAILVTWSLGVKIILNIYRTTMFKYFKLRLFSKHFIFQVRGKLSSLSFSKTLSQTS